LDSVTTSLYKTLNNSTSEHFSHLVDAKTYLTPRQEHDTIALIAACGISLSAYSIQNSAEYDTAITEEERVLLQGAGKSWKDAALATHIVLSHPRWIDSSL